MLQVGWKAGSEQYPPDELLDYAIAAEEAGFDAQFGSGHMNAPSPNRLVFQKSGLLAVGTSTSLLL
jgi:alkanesulfonate monooxygenase SsuD/methylene tetrahydromethanopterin reductase-like flavin-dependent oxidoreductase (luciferase family)